VIIIVFFWTVYGTLVVYCVCATLSTLPTDATSWYKSETDAMGEALGRENGAADFTRDEWQTSMDQTVWQNGWLLLLRRLTVIAPLCGVVLTAVAFITTDLDGIIDVLSSSNTGQVETNFSLLNPLFYGVLSGAVLAVINHGVVQGLTSRCVKPLHRKLRWQLRALLPPDEPTGQVGDLANTLRSLKIQFEGLRESLEQSTLKIQMQAEEGIAEVTTQATKGVGEIKTSTENLVSQLANVAAQCKTAGERLNDASTDYKKKLDTAAKEIGGSLSKVKAELDKVSTSLPTSAASVSTSMNKSASSVKDVAASVSTSMNKSASSVKDVSASVSTSMKESATSVREQAASVLTSMNKSATSVKDAADSMTEAAQAWKQNTPWKGAVDEVKGAVVEVQNAGNDLRTVAKKIGAKSKPPHEETGWLKSWFRKKS